MLNIIRAVALGLLLSGSPADAQMPAVNSVPTGCSTAGLPLVAGTPMACQPAIDGNNVYQAKGVVLGAGTGDKATITIPASITRYQVLGVSITNCSATPVLAALALWTGASGTGTNVVAAATITGATSSSVIINSTLAGSVATTMLTAGTIYINVTVANAAGLTCDIGIRIQDWT
jgi:hypothetical protein